MDNKIFTLLKIASDVLLYFAITIATNDLAVLVTRDSVYSVAFSPNGQYLASGSLDRCVHIWSVKEAKIVKTYTGKGGIFEVCWNREGDKVAACFANNIVCVMDFRM